MRRLKLTVFYAEIGRGEFTDLIGDEWELTSFNRRHYNFVDPSTLGIRTISWCKEPKVYNIGLRRQLKAGTAFWCSYYEHGQSLWFLPGTYSPPDMQWDGAIYAGVLRYCGDLKNLPKEYGLRRNYAEQYLEFYTKLVNGEVYGYVLEDEDGQVVDSCGGFIGTACVSGMEEAVRQVLEPGDIIDSVAGDAAFLFDDSELVGCEVGASVG